MFIYNTVEVFLRIFLIKYRTEFLVMMVCEEEVDGLLLKKINHDGMSLLNGIAPLVYIPIIF